MQGQKSPPAFRVPGVSSVENFRAVFLFPSFRVRNGLDKRYDRMSWLKIDILGYGSAFPRKEFREGKIFKQGNRILERFVLMVSDIVQWKGF